MDAVFIKLLNMSIAASWLILAVILLRVLLWCSPLAFGEVGVKQRVKAVLSYRKPAFWIVLIAIVACLITAVCFLTNSPKPYQTEVRIVSTVGNEGLQENGKEGLADVSEAGAQETEGDRSPNAEMTEPPMDTNLAPESSEVAYIAITNGNTGDEMTFDQSSSAFYDLLQLYGQLNFNAGTEENTRIGYRYLMRLQDADGVILHTVTPYKDGFSMDGLFYPYKGAAGLDQPSVNLMNAMDALFYPLSEEQIITRVLGRTAVGWSNSVNFMHDADILVKMAVDSTGEYEVYGIISKELGAYGLVLNDIIDGDDNHNYVYEPWVYTQAPRDEPKLEWSEDGKVLWFSYIAAEKDGEYVWRRCIVDCGYETGHMELLYVYD